MVEILSVIGRESFVPFWIPVVVWTGVAGTVAFGLTMTPRFHPLTACRLRQALLLALPASVVAALWVPVPRLLRPELPDVFGLAMQLPKPGAVGSSVPPGPGIDIPATLLGSATVVFVLLAVLRLAVLATALRRLRALGLAAPRITARGPNRVLRSLAENLGVHRPVRLLEGPRDCVPMTFHWRRPVIVLPRGLLDDPDSLRIVLAHELIHARRGDYVWALLENLASAAFTFHPLVWLLRRGIDRCREASCDSAVLGAGITRPDKYAEVLVGTHPRARTAMTAVAASLWTRSHTLKQRLEMMKRFADVRPTSGVWTVTGLAPGLVFLATTVLGACTGQTGDGNSSVPWLETVVVTAEARESADFSTKMVPTYIPYSTPQLRNPDEVQQAVAGEYPPELRDAGVRGTVLVWFFVDETGRVQNALVRETSGHEALDEAALRLAPVSRFSPARDRDGRTSPAWVEMPITFTIQ